MSFDGREPWQIPVLDEVERLRAELAAERVLCESYLIDKNQITQAWADELDRGKELAAERDALRAELAAVRESRQRWQRSVTELGAERDALHDDVNAFREANATLTDSAVAAQAERDDLRELLREAREQIISPNPMDCGPFNLISRIDAALTKGGGE